MMCAMEESMKLSKTMLKTRMQLVDAFKRLVMVKKISKITVADIADEAQLSKQTFYNHFLDKEDLVKWYCTSHLDADIQDLEDYFLYMQKENEFIMNNWDFFYRIEKEGSCWGWKRKWVYDHIILWIEKRHGKGAVTDELKELLEIWIYGTDEIFRKNVLQNNVEDSKALLEEYAQRSVNHMPALLKNYLVPNENREQSR